MKLKRESIKLDGYHGEKWYFCIYDDNENKLEDVETRLCAMETPNTAEHDTWLDYCDQCPCYLDGYGSGFWIPIELVEEFKKAWKIAKSYKK